MKAVDPQLSNCQCYVAEKIKNRGQIQTQITIETKGDSITGGDDRFFRSKDK